MTLVYLSPTSAHFSMRRLVRAVDDAVPIPNLLAGNTMKGWLCRLIAAASAAGILLAFAAPASAEKRVALVIGNNDYKNVPKLQKAVNDARTMLAIRLVVIGKSVDARAARATPKVVPRAVLNAHRFRNSG